MAHFFTSDWHLNHRKILEFCKDTRLFSDVSEMNDKIIKDCNKKVGKDDVLIHLGDFALNIGYKPEMMFDNLFDLRVDIVCRNIILYEGNHDTKRIKNMREAGLPLKNIYTEIRQHSVETYHNQQMFLSHYLALNAFKQRTKRWVLFGHSHGNLDLGEYKLDKAPCLDVGVDFHYKLFGNYEPWSFGELQEFMEDKTY